MVNKVSNIRVERWLYLFLIIHAVAWTLAPAFVRFDLPLDAMEGTIWGHQLEWGYDKNPFMNAWLTTLALKLDGMSGWGTYLFSQISVVIAFWAVWQLGKKMMPPLYALIAVLLLEGIQYNNLHAIDFNDNTIEIALWALTTLFFYQAVRNSTWRDWILTAVFAGLGMMTKYYTAMLLIPMGLFLLIYRDNRRQFSNPALYVAMAIMIAIMLPHVVWLFSHDFITVTYAIHRVSSERLLINHLFYPAQFAWQQLDTFIPVVILFFVFFIGRAWLKIFTHLKNNNAEENVTTFNKRFLIFMGLGPILLTIFISALFGMKLRAGWGQPLLTLWSLMLLAWYQPSVTAKQFYRFLFGMVVVLAILITGYCIALIRANGPSSANFPGKIISQQLTNEWHEKYHTPVTVIAGSRWLAGNIAFYSADKPAVYINWNKQLSPWIQEQQLKTSGAIFVWNLSENQAVSFEEIKKRFPTLEEQKTISFTWLRNTSISPIVVRIAYLPPSLPPGKFSQ